ncbi:YheU family protein [Cellvibrio sp. pealriver]|uniref:YheU family protein n=1 Tax=Cellvibrio sp. pealriver TaxID=1622269 RepID=UPI000A5EC303|nr:YheU family protein [Cellvibrio sp. pealriver]
MIVPYDQISEDALQGLIEEFITRDGTDYGFEEVPLSIKVEQVKLLLKRREVVVVFDPAYESVTLLPRRDAELLEQGASS